MLFNSYEFILVFLPVALIGFYVLGVVSRAWALHWLILVSIFFYTWWRPVNVLIIAPSILINFVLARILAHLGEDDKGRRWAKTILVLGIAFNVAFLGYFKYVDFTRATINEIFGANMVLTHVILPLGISFITFQKIAFLIDVYSGRVKSFTLRDYALFVLFFPQLIAGPIVHFREMMPQFASASCRFDKENVSIGLTLFFFGLFKKVFLADHIGPLVAPIYEHGATGLSVSLLPAWMAAIGFTLQIYFDFSGYSDMALGLARFFGVRLPPNFNSPLKASSIIDFWLRWHMSLTRFLTAYIYNPLLLSLTRRRMARGMGGRVRTSGLSTFVYVLMFPTLLTMFVSGLWHGAGYTFILWGLLHGAYLSVNHGWRLMVPKMWPDRATYDRFMTPIGFACTFIAVTASMVVFRSPTVKGAANILKGMMGLNGFGVPQDLYDRLGPLAGWLQGVGAVSEVWSGQSFAKTAFWIVVLLFIALACPNTLQILARYEPALGIRVDPTESGTKRPIVEWSFSLAWAVAVSIVAAIGVFFVGRQSEFLYWQF